MTETWRDYEKMVYGIYTELCEVADAKYNDKIFGKKSKTDRQIDVSIRLNVASHELLIIVQAKDLSTPADVNVVGELVAVMDDVGASKGVLVCNAGFTEAAKNMAKESRIDLCTAHDSKSEKWAIKIQVPMLWVDFQPMVKLELSLKPDMPQIFEVQIPHDPKRWTIIGPDQKTVLLGTVMEGLVDISKLCESAQSKVTLVGPGHRLLFSKGYSAPIEKLDLNFDPNPKVFEGTLNIKDCREFRNLTTNEIRTRLKLSGKDLPSQRDPNWKEAVGWNDKKLKEHKGFRIEAIPANLSELTFGSLDMFQ